MRLLRTDTLQLEEFTGDYNGQYAILSHTWEEGEVSLQDMLLVAKDVHLTSPEAQTVIAKAGYRKIKEFARVAAADGFSHVWADTCCIDKTSSAELSEAINSMFRWYKNGARCYVYLADVPDGWDDGLEAAWLLSGSDVPSHYKSLPWPRRGAIDHPFYQSRWFTRGWTLQELIAPADLVFYSSTWTLGPTKEDIITTISQITGIDVKTLATGDCSSISVADRMRWASMRATTRIEDMAYCLLGIFDVNMPMLYGEGEKAFLRLQEEICRNSNDHTLFAWRQKRTAADMTWSSINSSNSDVNLKEAISPYRGLFARTPDEFSIILNGSLAPIESDGFVPPLGTTSLGFNAIFPLIPISDASRLKGIIPAVDMTDKDSEFLAVLDANMVQSWHRAGNTSRTGHRVAILLKSLSPNGSTRQFVRIRPTVVYTLMDRTRSTLPSPLSLYIRHTVRIPENHVSRRWGGFIIDGRLEFKDMFKVWSPYDAWDEKKSLVRCPASSQLELTQGVAAMVVSTELGMPFTAFLGRCPLDSSPVFWLLREKTLLPATFDFSRVDRLESFKIEEGAPKRHLKYKYNVNEGSVSTVWFTLAWNQKLQDDLLVCLFSFRLGYVPAVGQDANQTGPGWT